MGRFLTLVILVVSAHIISSPTQAGDSIACDSSPKYAEWDRNCKRWSEIYKANLPTNSSLVDAQCSDWTYLTKSESTRCRQYKMTANHLHVIVVEAFHAKRLDHRRQALYTLSHYRCEDDEACKEFAKLMDRAVVSNSLVWRKTMPDLLILAETIKNRLFENRAE